MSKLITREAFKISLKAIKDYIEKKLKSVLSETKNIAEDIIKSASKEFVSKSELDSNAQNDHVAIFKQTDTGVNLLDSGYSIGDQDLGEIIYVYPVTGDGYYNTSTEIYGYTSHYIWQNTDFFVYQDTQLSVPIAQIVSSAPWTMRYFSIPGDINSPYTGDPVMVSATKLSPIVKRIVSPSIIATESGVANYVEEKILNTVHTEVSGSEYLLPSNTRTVISNPLSTNMLFNFDSDTANKEIVVIFKLAESAPSNFQCTFNVPLAWQNDNTPTWEAGKTYEISIFNNLAVYTSYVV